MKKKILLSLVIFVSVFFSFGIKGKADLTCTYTIEDPFVRGDKPGYYAYMYNLVSTHFYQINGRYEEFQDERDAYLENYKKYLSSIPSGTGNISEWEDPVNITSVELTVNFYDNKTLVATDTYAYSNFSLILRNMKGKTIGLDYYSHDIYKGNECPDLILYDRFNGYFSPSRYEIYEDINSEEIDTFLRNRFGKLTEELTDNYYCENHQTYHKVSYFYFMSDKMKRGINGLMYIFKGRNEEAYRYHENVLTIDDVVDKYSSIKEILEGINELLDKTFGQSTFTDDNLDTLNPYFLKVVDKIISGELELDSLLTIGNQLNKLHEFNDDIVDLGCHGLNACLNNMLMGTGYKSKDWFDIYMPNSKEQYVEALIYVLEYIQENYSFISDYKSVNEFNEKLADVTVDNVENLCNKNLHIIARSLCMSELKDNASELEDYYSCLNNMNLPESYCDGKEKDDLLNDIENGLEKFKEANSNLSIWYSKKIMNQRGFEIDAVDFCDILKTDLIDYIKIVMNIIRIGGPVLIVFLTAFDAIKMIASFKEDESKKFWKNLKIRLICLVILILVPTIVNWIVKLVIEGACIVEF